MDTKGDSYKEDLCDDTQINHRLMDSKVISSKKRASPCCYSQGEKKFRKEIDAVANSREIVLEKDLHTFKENRNRICGSESLRALTFNDTASSMSSCGSCSDNSYNRHDMHSGSGFVEDIEAHESDAESVCQFAYNEETDQVQSPSNEYVEDEIPELELQAYRRAIEIHNLGKSLISAANNTLIR